jgi:hypothetical protein
MPEQNNFSTILITILITVLLLGLGAFGFWFWQNNIQGNVEPSPSVLTPESSPSQVIKPSSEIDPSPQASAEEAEEPQTSDLDNIKQAFAEKYSRDISEVDISIDKNTGTYANGLVKFAGEISGGWFLAYNDNGLWIIVADGNGTVMCEDIEPYNFPTDMVPECWDEDTMTLVER